MAHQTSSVHYEVPSLQIWARLAAEHRVQVIWLMAQLALKLVLADPNSPLKEVQRGVISDLSQDSG
jgi:hypothetical protein